MPEVLIEARGIHAYYGVSHVLHGVDLVLNRGEAVGLMGRNGMGKTTLLRSIIGLLPPRSGEVKVRGKDMTRAAPHRIARAGVAYVPVDEENLDISLILLFCPPPLAARSWSISNRGRSLLPSRRRRQIR